ncbi:cellulase family glycosylhydrolase [Aegicerativicinus sediminis]|uniref:cellulase family glycosylhydrolase n=1 Tax=Aegicerativicinus sediminis TaxID=2893202 RepID=UPI001E31F01B|nr:cellulase family glycosylhydrolase [Aegicerativicinus sediminis]
MISKFSLRFSLVFILGITVGLSFAQNPNKHGQTFVDDKGVIRWSETNAEVHGFGVNYTVPFAHAYRTAKRMGVDIKKAMESDVYHFKRLGFNLYRIHVWDTEISDDKGNLLDNEHLDAFDYLISILKKHDINYVLTPIAFWGNGWPEPDEETPGFSHKYGKSNALTDPGAIKAQQNYLKQFISHTNPYTKLTYKDDPSVIAFEVSNEPHHRGTSKEINEFVKGMVDAIKSTGSRKPIFYNTSHAVHEMESYFKAGIDGGTFQWYPSGLGYQKELEGNFLPNVDSYDMPFDGIIAKYGGAKIVYEFDAADIGKSYIYPAIARSFRTAGIQIATHFAYDPTFMASVNTEYNTHYMNLAYTPKKALALKISGEVFMNIPINESFGSYPDNTKFQDFYIDYAQDLAVYNQGEKFFYSNSTSIVPKSINNLKEIAGYGNSSIIQYGGAGAYFLDKLKDGVWRLEVMPDAVWVRDPFGKNSPNKTVGVIKWRNADMKINLPDLGNDFKIRGINSGNTYNSESNLGSFQISPGTYLLESSKSKFSSDQTFNGYEIGSFFAPKDNVKDYWFKHQPPMDVVEESDLELVAQFVGPSVAAELTIEGYTDVDRFSIKMKEFEPYQFKAVVPKSIMRHGLVNYRIIVKIEEDSMVTYPGAINGSPRDWDFYGAENYSIRIHPKTDPIYLFDATKDSKDLVRTWRRGLALKPASGLKESEYRVYIDGLFKPDSENLNADPIYDYSIKHFVIDELKSGIGSLSEKEKIVFKGRSLQEKPQIIQIALVQNDGSAFGGELLLSQELDEYKLNLEDLKLVKTVILPRPYPSFLPYFFNPDKPKEFDINAVESIQISVGPGLTEKEQKESQGFGVVFIKLE